ncbi:hypothetical protein [Streptomyces sp. NPDC093795]
MGDVDGGRTVGRMVRVSVLVLLVEAALTAAGLITRRSGRRGFRRKTPA